MLAIGLAASVVPLTFTGYAGKFWVCAYFFIYVLTNFSKTLFVNSDNSEIENLLTKQIMDPYNHQQA